MNVLYVQYVLYVGMYKYVLVSISKDLSCFLNYITNTGGAAFLPV